MNQHQSKESEKEEQQTVEDQVDDVEEAHMFSQLEFQQIDDQRMRNSLDEKLNFL